MDVNFDGIGSLTKENDANKRQNIAINGGFVDIDVNLLRSLVLTGTAFEIIVIFDGNYSYLALFVDGKD